MMLYRRFPMTVGGIALNQNLPFQAKSLAVDNPTNAWIQLGFDVKQFVPPYTMGAVYLINDTAVRAEFLAPNGLTNPPAIANQFATLIYYDASLPPSAGVGVLGNRAAYYDRNNLSVVEHATQLLSTEGSGTQTIWTYTVPSGRAAFVESIMGIVTFIRRFTNQVDLTGNDFVETSIRHEVVFPAVGGAVGRAIVQYGVKVGTDARFALGTNLELRTGETLIASAINNRNLGFAGNGIAVHTAAAKINEFDAA